MFPKEEESAFSQDTCSTSAAIASSIFNEMFLPYGLITEVPSISGEYDRKAAAVKARFSWPPKLSSIKFMSLQIHWCHFKRCSICMYKQDDPMTAHRKIVPAWIVHLCGVRTSTSNGISPYKRLESLVGRSMQATFKLHTAPSMEIIVKPINPSSRAIIDTFPSLSLGLDSFKVLEVMARHMLQGHIGALKLLSSSLLNNKSTRSLLTPTTIKLNIPKPTMKCFTQLLIIASYFTISQATNVNGDPTDLTNYPTCAVRRPSSLNQRTDRGPPAKMHPLVLRSTRQLWKPLKPDLYLSRSPLFRRGYRMRDHDV